MFTVYHSNQLDLLKLLASELIKKTPLNSVFESEKIIVQSNGMAKWLQIQLADDLNIAANISFIQPGQFIWQMYHLILPNVPEKHAFEKESLIWHFLSLLPDVIDYPEFIVLKRYIDTQDTEQKYFQLAVRIADLYDNYLIYRPEWIKKWQQGEMIDSGDNDEHWQAKLWLKLVQQIERLSPSFCHRADIYQQFITALKKQLDPTISAKLPKRVFIFGIASLPPLILDSLSALGKHIDIHFMLTNPCRWYWGDIPDEKWLRRLLHKKWQHYKDTTKRYVLKNNSLQKTDVTAMLKANPLLASWGKLGRDNLFLLQDYCDKVDIDAFVDLDSSRILHVVQQHILDLSDGTIIGHDKQSFETSEKKIKVADNDFSLSFHVCHSELREVEVLYDYLLDLFDNDPTCSLCDVVVMVADIDNYAPYINAIFGGAPDDRYIPYSISDQKIHTIDPIVTAFLSLVNLSTSRFTTEDLFDLLAVPAIAKQFNIDDKGLKLLHNWTVAAGIRWGLNEEMLLSLGIANGGQHTWQYGLTRMLLGYVMRSEQGEWQTIMPFDASAGLAAELVGKLATVLMKLTTWYRFLAQEKTLSEWQQAGEALLNDFFFKDSNSEPMIMLLENEWQAAIEDGLLAGFDKTISIKIMQNIVQQRLKNTHLQQRFLVGKINFCTLMPMRGIPFKVVCLLGMNDGTYPRLSPSLSFDLINKRPKRGDRNRRDDDRYLFLEAILSAQKKLYISYLGKNIKDDSCRYPSVLVDELRNYVAHSVVLEKDKTVNLDDSANRLIHHLTISHPRMPFNPGNYQIDKSKYLIGSYADEWLPAARRQGTIGHFLTSLPPLATQRITVEELKQFYQHPIRSLLQKRLGVFFNLTDHALPTVETFTLTGLERYQINQQLLNQLITNGNSVDNFVKRVKAEGTLPYGVFGDLELAAEYEKINQLAIRVLAEKQQTTRYEVAITFQDMLLEGWLIDVQQDGLLRFKPTELQASDGMSLWLEHLMLTLISDNTSIHSRLYGVNDAAWHFQSLSKQSAYQHLSELISGYVAGMSEPLLLPIRSAWDWLECCFSNEIKTIMCDKETTKKARQLFIKRWYGNDKVPGECDDYYMRVVPELQDSHFAKIEQATTAFLLPMKLSQRG